jgi:hypothetical protein
MIAVEQHAIVRQFVTRVMCKRKLAIDERLEDARFLLHDRDSKYSGPFDEVFRTEGARIIHTPIRAPRANSFAERWVRTVRAECLDWTLVLGLVLLMLARGLDPASIRALRDRLGATIGFGLLWFVLLPIVAVLLFVTIVGIPLGLFLLFALGLVYSIGYVVGGLALGRLVVKEPTSRYLAFLAGWGALRVIALVPFLGGIAWLVGTVLGLGTLWVAARAPSGDRTVRVPESPSAEREAV